MDHPSTTPTSTSSGIAPAYPPSHSHVDYHAAAAATATAALSHHTPTPNNAAAGNTRKRKASGAPGSRGVANLTPEQLAKKRANDREAQRAIRERTKNTIEALERRIRELEGQQPFQELQRVVAERDRALAECEELRRRLGAVAGIVGAQHPSLNGEFTMDQLLDTTLLTEADAELAALTAQQSPLPPVQHNVSSHANAPQAHAPPYEYEQQQLHPDLRSPQSASGSPPPQARASSHTYQEGEEALRKWSSSNQHFTPSNTSTPAYEHRSSVQLPTPTNGERLGVSFLLESTTQHSPNTPQQLPPTPESPTYARTTNVGPPSCPLDSLLLDFHRSRRKMLHDGASVEEALGPAYPDWAALVNKKSASHPVSCLLIDILSKFPDIANLPEKVAVLYIMFLIMRWLIHPDRETYERLPPFCRPVPEQIEHSHVAWCDYLPWYVLGASNAFLEPHESCAHCYDRPGMRKAITMRDSQVQFEDFFIPYTTTLSLNWPLPQDHILIRNDKDGDGSLRLNPAFEAHLRNIDNWSLGAEFKRAFPDLVEDVRTQDT